MCIHHWRILWSSFRKLAWVEFEPTTTEFRSDALTDWAIRPWVQLALRASFVQLLQFHRLFSVTFHFGYCLRQSPRLFSSNFFCLFFCWGNHMSVAVSYIQYKFFSCFLTIPYYVFLYLWIWSVILLNYNFSQDRSQLKYYQKKENCLLLDYMKLELKKKVWFWFRL